MCVGCVRKHVQYHAAECIKLSNTLHTFTPVWHRCGRRGNSAMYVGGVRKYIPYHVAECMRHSDTLHTFTPVWHRYGGGGNSTMYVGGVRKHIRYHVRHPTHIHTCMTQMRWWRQQSRESIDCTHRCQRMHADCALKKNLYILPSTGNMWQPIHW